MHINNLYILVLCLFVSTFSLNCATVPDIDSKLPQLEFTKEQPYVLDLTNVKKIEKPNFIYLLVDDKTNQFRVAKDNEIPTHVALLESELVKIDAMLDVKNFYRDVAKDQEALINIEKDKINSLKEMIMLERQNRQLERDLRLDVEKAYKQERRDHRIDNIIDRASLIGVVIGGIAIAAL